MLAQETGEVFLCCLTISHPTLSAPFYLVNDYNPLTRTVPVVVSESLVNVQKHGTTLSIITGELPSNTPAPCSFVGLSIYTLLNGQTLTPTSVVPNGSPNFTNLTFTVPASWPDFGPSGETGSVSVPQPQTVEFVPFAFDVSLPNEQEDQLPQVAVTIDNIDNKILVAIRNIPGERPKIRLEVLLASQPDTVEAGPFDFSILNINYTDASIQGAIGFEDDLLSTAFPADTYTPTNSRGLFV
jgi:hypothetical protein